MYVLLILNLGCRQTVFPKQLTLYLAQETGTAELCFSVVSWLRAVGFMCPQGAYMVDLFTISVWTVFWKIITYFPVVTFSYLNTEEYTQVPMSEVSSIFSVDRMFQGFYVLGLLSWLIYVFCLGFIVSFEPANSFFPLNDSFSEILLMYLRKEIVAYPLLPNRSLFLLTSPPPSPVIKSPVYVSIIFCKLQSVFTLFHFLHYKSYQVIADNNLIHLE